MIYLKKLFFVGFIFSMLGLFASSNLDSTKKSDKYNPDIKSESIYQRITLLLNQDNCSDAIFKASKYLDKVMISGDSSELAYAYYSLGCLQEIKGDNVSAFENTTNSYSLYKSIDDAIGTALCMNIIGVLLRRQGSYKEAFKYHTKALNIFIKNHDTCGITNSYNDLGLVYRQTGDLTKAYEFYTKALDLKTKNCKLSAVIYNNIGSYYWHQNDYDSAFYYYKKVLDCTNLNLLTFETRCAATNNIGNIYRRIKMNDSALYFYDKALSESRLLGFSNLEAIVLKNYGIIFKDLGHLEKAQDAINKSLEIAEKMKIYRIAQLDFILLTNIFELKGDYKNALYYYKKYTNLSITKNIQEQSFLIRQHEIEFNFEVIAKENALLKKRIAEESLLQQQQYYQKISYSVFIILLLLIIIFIYYLYSTNKKAKNKLEKLNNLLEEKVAKRTKHLSLEVTEHKQTSQKLLISKEKAEESERLKSAFLANMSHEIRTPMNGILGFANLLLSTDLSSENSTKYIDLINKSGLRLLNTINDIIAVSKIDSYQISINIEKVNLSEQMDEIYSFFEVQCREKGISLKMNNCILPSTVTAKTDKTKFVSILTNLINNAIKYTDKGEIIVDCTKERGQITFFVKDTGIGIPKERQDAIFNRFEQADIEDSYAREGSGLGLSISKSYIEMLGGKIWVESEVNKGSTFFFMLPLELEEDTISHEPPLELESSIEKSLNNNSKKIKILIAEDDIISFNFFTTILRKRNYELLHAKTGTQTVEICKNNQDIDIILLDIRMPEMDGYEAVKEIRKFNKKVFVVAQTAYAFSFDKEKALESGCNEYISKPINRNKLFRIIDNFLIDNHLDK